MIKIVNKTELPLMVFTDSAGPIRTLEEHETKLIRKDELYGAENLLFFRQGAFRCLKNTLVSSITKNRIVFEYGDLPVPYHAARVQKAWREYKTRSQNQAAIRLQAIARLHYTQRSLAACKVQRFFRMAIKSEPVACSWCWTCQPRGFTVACSDRCRKRHFHCFRCVRAHIDEIDIVSGIDDTFLRCVEGDFLPMNDLIRVLSTEKVTKYGWATEFKFQNFIASLEAKRVLEFNDVAHAMHLQRFSQSSLRIIHSTARELSMLQQNHDMMREADIVVPFSVSAPSPVMVLVVNLSTEEISIGTLKRDGREIVIQPRQSEWVNLERVKELQMYEKPFGFYGAWISKGKNVDLRSGDAIVVRGLSLAGRVQFLRIRHKLASAVKAQAVVRGFLTRSVVRTCFICLDEIPLPLTCLTSPTCGHRVCVECFKTYLEIELNEGKIKILCPENGCFQQLTDADMVRFFSFEKIVGRLEKAKARHLDYLKVLGSSEDDPDSQFLAWAKENTRTCPQCRVIIYRFEGCDSISCTCGYNFNWAEASNRVDAVINAA